MKVLTQPYASRSSHDEVYHTWAAKPLAEKRSASRSGAFVRQGKGQTAAESRATAGGDPGRDPGRMGAFHDAPAASPGAAPGSRWPAPAVRRPQHFADGAGSNRVAQIL